jgi:hypothetical protein
MKLTFSSSHIVHIIALSPVGTTRWYAHSHAQLGLTSDKSMYHVGELHINVVGVQGGWVEWGPGQSKDAITAQKGKKEHVAMVEKLVAANPKVKLALKEKATSAAPPTSNYAFCVFVIWHRY